VRREGVESKRGSGRDLCEIADHLRPYLRLILNRCVQSIEEENVDRHASGILRLIAECAGGQGKRRNDGTLCVGLLLFQAEDGPFLIVVVDVKLLLGNSVNRSALGKHHDVDQLTAFLTAQAGSWLRRLIGVSGRWRLSLLTLEMNRRD